MCIAPERAITQVNTWRSERGTSKTIRGDERRSWYNRQVTTYDPTRVVTGHEGCIDERRVVVTGHAETGGRFDASSA